jgi:hypothetical protein
MSGPVRIQEQNRTGLGGRTTLYTGVKNVKADIGRMRSPQSARFTLHGPMRDGDAMVMTTGGARPGKRRAEQDARHGTSHALSHLTSSTSSTLVYGPGPRRSSSSFRM